MKKLLGSGDKKQMKQKKEAVSSLKALLIESNALRKRSQDIMKKDIPKQDIEIKETEKKLKLMKYSFTGN